MREVAIDHLPAKVAAIQSQDTIVHSPIRALGSKQI
jgi:hypothetical protein